MWSTRSVEQGQDPAEIGHLHRRRKPRVEHGVAGAVHPHGPDAGGGRAHGVGGRARHVQHGGGLDAEPGQRPGVDRRVRFELPTLGGDHVVERHGQRGRQQGALHRLVAVGERGQPQRPAPHRRQHLEGLGPWGQARPGRHEVGQLGVRQRRVQRPQRPAGRDLDGTAVGGGLARQRSGHQQVLHVLLPPGPCDRHGILRQPPAPEERTDRRGQARGDVVERRVDVEGHDPEIHRQPPSRRRAPRRPPHHGFVAWASPTDRYA